MRLLRRPRALFSEHAPSAGARLRDRFELLVPLGSGGFGTVWEGFDMLLERSVAVKEIDLATRTASSTDLALREARATARLNHPGIVSLYEVVQEDGKLYLVSELVDGYTLAELQGEGTLSDRDVAVIGGALCEALAHAHGQGVVHRDVKPANVMVPRAWCEQVAGWRAQPAKLMDFGIASVCDDEETLIAGSRAYMAPESHRGKHVSPAADVYSLAAVLFECFTGEPPQATRSARRRDQLAVRRSDLPEPLAAVIDAALGGDPVLRPQLGDVADELAAAEPQLADTLARRSLLHRLGGQLRQVAPRAQAPTDVTSRALAAVGLLALAALVNGAIDVALSPIALALAAMLGAVAPRYAPLLFSAAAAGALAGGGYAGAAVLVASLALPGALAAVPELRRAGIGACAAWSLLVCGVIGDRATLLALPAGPPPHERVLHDVSAGFEALFTLAAPAALATTALWALAAFVAPWVTHGPRRLGAPLRASLWLGAAAGGQLVIALLLGTQLAPVALAIAAAAVAVAGVVGFVQWRGGRVAFGPQRAAAITK